MALCPHVRFIAEGSGDLIIETPGLFSVPRKNGLVSLATDGGDVVEYKVESAKNVLQASTLSNPVGGGADKYAIGGYVEVVLSVVP